MPALLSKLETAVCYWTRASVSQGEQVNSWQVLPVIPPSSSFLTNFPLLHLIITPLALNLIILHLKHFLTHIPALEAGPFPTHLPYCHQNYLKPKSNDSLACNICFPTVHCSALWICRSSRSLPAVPPPWHRSPNRLHTSSWHHRTLFIPLWFCSCYPSAKMPFHSSSIWRSCNYNARSSSSISSSQKD